jgi:phage shock protein A
MSYFSRLTDIVTCNLPDMLLRETDPKSAIRRIIAEMEEGLGGARRSVSTASAAVVRLRAEIAEHRGRVAHWVEQAKRELAAGRDDAARMALLRKQEVEDLLGGLEQQRAAAEATEAHLSTTLRALEARLTEARRTMHHFEAGEEFGDAVADVHAAPSTPVDASRARQVEAELEELKRSLGGS